MSETRVLVADLFRRESGRLIALLAARAGANRIDAVEDAVQDALAAAMRTWPVQGVPRNPSGWLFAAARNALLDRVRRGRFEVVREAELESAVAPNTSFSGEEALDDELLRLIAFCCHPSLTPAAQIALTLRLACGLSVDEIAGALLTSNESILQRIVRAKRDLRALDVSLDLSARDLVENRLPGILNAIYLLFDAGYLNPRHEQWVRPMLCDDALRLSRLLAAHPATREPATQALTALLHLAAARLPARVDADGRPVPLALQDRTKWDGDLIAAGFAHLSDAIRGESLTRYHIEAAIAATHARAASVEMTDWTAILGYYDQLCELYPSPVASLNRIIALRYARGAAMALAALKESDELGSIQDTLVYHATLAELHDALGEHDKAAEAFKSAANLASSSTLAALFRDRERGARERTR
jgi:RNA polymerase sigma-70 factor, ECF subfamily